MVRIHGVSASPFVRKVRLAMIEKNLRYEIVPVMPFAPPPGFEALSPLGKVPVYQDGDFVLPDSSCILAYLEKAHPSPPLYPSDPKSYGKALFFEEYADSRLAEAVAAVFAERIVKKLMKQPPDEARIEKGLTELLPRAFTWLDAHAPAAGDAIVEGRFGVADIAIGTQLANLAHAGEKIDASRFPKLAAYVERVFARPSFAACIDEERRMFSQLVG
jgi:glutathione S-transferase